MPRAPRHCPGDNGGCINLIASSQKYCPDHQPVPWRGKRTTSSAVTNTAEWKRLRRKVLERDGYQCQIRGPHCTGHATQVDHIVNTAAGGAPFDEHNAQSVCPQCNARKASAEAAAARRAQPRRTNKRPPERHPGLKW
ncbi:HNH endonuclease [Mycobacterium colombiense]|uniref:HNH endonuclease n=1 Tax=Mycobacterium colombiense TaxID=339268 RepID=UPI00096E5884|nr:HNH endonuclease signature motif containing protein [Mycobacterium colombiense]